MQGVTKAYREPRHCDMAVFVEAKRPAKPSPQRSSLVESFHLFFDHFSVWFPCHLPRKESTAISAADQTASAEQNQKAECRVNANVE